MVEQIFKLLLMNELKSVNNAVLENDNDILTLLVTICYHCFLYYCKKKNNDFHPSYPQLHKNVMYFY